MAGKERVGGREPGYHPNAVAEAMPDHPHRSKFMMHARSFLLCIPLLGFSACGTSDAVGPITDAVPGNARDFTVSSDTITTSSTGSPPGSEPPTEPEDEPGEGGGAHGSGG